MTTELVIVGGGATAHNAMTAYRKNGGARQVIMISEDDRPPYNRPPLSKDFLRGYHIFPIFDSFEMTAGHARIDSARPLVFS